MKVIMLCKYIIIKTEQNGNAKKKHNISYLYTARIVSYCFVDILRE